MRNEGYVKFNYTWYKSKPLNLKLIQELNKTRDELYKLKLIGAYSNNIGFGNISIRNKKGYIISGTETGNIKKLTNKHYTFVSSWNFKNNHLTCLGPIVASSESLTHAAIYESNKNIKAVIHIHSLKLWRKLLKTKLPQTNPLAPYGTVALVDEIKRLFKETNIKQKKIIILAGHKEGIISFGKNLNEAEKILLNYFTKIKSALA